MIRYHPHGVGINQSIEPIHDLSKAELLTLIQSEARSWHEGRIASHDIGFDLIHVTGEGDTRDCSEAFLAFLSRSGFQEVYSVMLHSASVGYADCKAW